MSDEELAKAIARAIFTTGSGQHAARLVLELPDGRDGGGWCEESVVDQILKVLQQPSFAA